MNHSKLYRTPLALLLALALLFGLSACSGTTASETAAEEIYDQITDLVVQENEIIKNHNDLWNRVFDQMTADTTDTGADYCTALLNQIEAMQNQFTEDELSTLKADVELIRPLEEQLAPLMEQYENSEADAAETAASETPSTFPAFTGKDLDGNDVDNSIFAQHSVTLVNFWFSACSPCVEELSTLNEFNNSLQEQGGAVIGINVDTLNGDESAIAEAKHILEEQGASYSNIYFDSSSEAGQYAATIMAFPTSILVDRNGNIVYESILGGLDDEVTMSIVQKLIDDIIASDSGSNQ